MFDRVEPPEDEPILSVEVETVEEPVFEGELQEFEDGSYGYEEEPPAPPVAFNANLALTFDEAKLRELGSQIAGDIDADKMSRQDWEDAYRKGLNLLGMKTEDVSTPWPGACGLFSTLIPEAVVRFQSNAIMEIFPPSGPAKANIIGEITEEREKQAQRVVAEFNYQLVEKLEDYRPETEKLLFGLATCGSAFRKLYPDPITGEPAARYIPAEKFIVPYGAVSLRKSPRYTEVFTISKNELHRLQVSGFYKDIPVDEAMPVTSSLQEKKDEINREDPPPTLDGEIELFECHADVDLGEDPDGIALPYIVTLDQSGTVIGLYRNWREDDPFKQKILWYVEYTYVPGLGFYGYGLLHLIGASAKAATMILRQLIDAGTLDLHLFNLRLLLNRLSLDLQLSLLHLDHRILRLCLSFFRRSLRLMLASQTTRGLSDSRRDVLLDLWRHVVVHRRQRDAKFSRHIDPILEPIMLRVMRLSGGEDRVRVRVLPKRGGGRRVFNVRFQNRHMLLVRLPLVHLHRLHIGDHLVLGHLIERRNRFLVGHNTLSIANTQHFEHLAV